MKPGALRSEEVHEAGRELEHLFCERKDGRTGCAQHGEEMGSQDPHSSYSLSNGDIKQKTEPGTSQRCVLGGQHLIDKSSNLRDSNRT